MTATAVGLVAGAAAVSGVVGGGGARTSATRPATRAPQPVAVAAAAGHRVGAEWAHARRAALGLTTPTRGDGARVQGGTVYFAENPGAAPNYIFPMYAAQYCGIGNIETINSVYAPLYWFGDNYSPTVDYGVSVGRKPVASNHGRTYTVHLRHYRWSNGERVTADDVVFWMNMLESAGSTGWCGYVPGLFPSNVKSYRALNASTFQLTFKRAYNPTWVLYNELSQIYPLPLAWDRTSLSGRAPRRLAGSVGATRSGAGRVYRFLNAQSKDTGSWARSPLWQVVDGPFRVAGFTQTSQVTLVPNRRYSGSPKPSIARLIEVPFTSDTAEFDQIKAAGPNGLTVASLPPQDAPQTGAVAAEGYDVNKGAGYGINYLELNEHNPQLGPVFRQLYFRQAFQHLIDQRGWIHAILHGTAVPDYGPVPSSPANPLISVNTSNDPYPFSVRAAKRLLTTHGWKVAPGAATVCVRPGSGRGRCGAGVSRGEQISFTMNYATGSVSMSSEMQDLQAQLARVGIKMALETHTANEVIDSIGTCTAKQARCSWQAANYGAGWGYDPDFFPTGEDLFAAGSASNDTNYDSPTMNKLIQESLVAPASRENAVMSRFVRYTERQLPVQFEPESIGTLGSSAGVLVSKKLGGFTANPMFLIAPQFWYLTK